MTRAVAGQFAGILVAAGVKRIYRVVGDSLNGLTDALRRQGKIEWVHVRHEAAAPTGPRFHALGQGPVHFPADAALRGYRYDVFRGKVRTTGGYHLRRRGNRLGHLSAQSVIRLSGTRTDHD